MNCESITKNNIQKEEEKESFDLLMRKRHSFHATPEVHTNNHMVTKLWVFVTSQF
jgi:hypothetical protein